MYSEDLSRKKKNQLESELTWPSSRMYLFQVYVFLLETLSRSGPELLLSNVQPIAVEFILSCTVELQVLKYTHLVYK